ncbi:MAG: ribonuclease P protein component [Sulfuricella denitrificans]|nr:ribonuclease P protein component [Sulfuricella denitrificans]
MVDGFGFTKARQLLKTDEISSVFSFNHRFSSEHFHILIKPGIHEFARMAVIVSKKTTRLATARNYIKRVSREIFRLHQHQLAGLDVVIRIRKGFLPSDYVMIVQELRSQFDSAGRKFTLVEKPSAL